MGTEHFLFVQIKFPTHFLQNYCAVNPYLLKKSREIKMSESHFDKYEHYNYDQDKAMFSGHSGKQRSKKEAAQNTNHHNPGGHERKITNKLMNAEKNNRERTNSK